MLLQAMIIVGLLRIGLFIAGSFRVSLFIESGGAEDLENILAVL